MVKYLFVLLIVIGTAAANAAPSDFVLSPEWLAIGHYRPALFGYKATIGSDNFYLSPQGRRNPQAELEASIKLFQSSDDSKKCFFPARYQLLKNAKIIDVPFPKCDEFEQFKKDLQPSGVTLLFTDAYMNNSSSLFGHTLLRIDTARKGTQLLAHGINYGAWTQGYENSFLYALYGLTGAYPGGYTTKPYYDIINTYNNLENRDIWEYNLDFSQEELDLFVAHIWELGHTTTPYYFFTRNCSYMLMEAFDAVRPSLKLSDDFPLQAIPLDTVKAVAARKDFVKSVKYRPSRERKIKHRISQMDKEQNMAFVLAVKSEDWAIQDLDSEKKADVLETAYQYIQYQYVAGDLNVKEYRKKSFALLKARNSAASGQKFNELDAGANPLYAHDSKQIEIGTGVQNGSVFQQISLRPAYHSLIDNGYGYLQGAEINFLNAVFRHYDRDNSFVLQKLDVLQLASLSPLDEMFKAVSYRIDFNTVRWINPKSSHEGYIGEGSVSGGGTFALSDNLWLYGLSSIDGAYGGVLAHNGWIGTGLTSGLLFNHEYIGMQAEVKKVFASHKQGSTLKWQFALDWYVGRNTAIEFNFAHTQNYGRNLNESFIALKQYF